MLTPQVVYEGGGGAPHTAVGLVAGVAGGLALLVEVGGEELVNGVEVLGGHVCLGLVFGSY